MISCTRVNDPSTKRRRLRQTKHLNYYCVPPK